MSDNNKGTLFQAIKKNLVIRTIYITAKELKNLICYGRIYPVVYIVSKDKKVAYLNNSKVACSSIKASMIDEETKGTYTMSKQLGRLDMRRPEKLKDDEKDFFTFTFVRNPYERLVSCYESKYHTDKEKYHLKRLYFDCYLAGYIRKDRGFDKFLDRILKLPNSLLDQHFLVQYELIYDRKGNKRVQYIGKFENLAEEFGEIQKKYDLKALPHYNNSGVGKKKNWKDYYTLETAELVYQKYKKDFECFGYENYYTELIEYLKNKS